MKQKKIKIVIIYYFFFCSMADITRAAQCLEPLVFDRLYPETPVSRVLRTMKQLYAILETIKEPEEQRDNSVLARIIEIQSLSVCGALQELDRSIKNGLQVSDDHVILISNFWQSLLILVKDGTIERYFESCYNP